MIKARPLAGRILALAGLLLIALNLRTAVSSLSPIIPFVRDDFELSTLSVSFLGMLPPLSFAIGGLVAPAITRRIGLEAALLGLLFTIVVGILIRASSGDWSILSLGTLLALVGMGMGNVLLPVVVRKYFPDRIGAMTAMYLVIVSIGAFSPALIAVPVAEAYGWRLSLGQWAVLAAIAALPWLFALRGNRPEEELVTAALAVPINVRHVRIWKSPTAMAMVVIWSVSSLNGYSNFAWLPQILLDDSGSTPAEAGILLALYAAMGIPAALAMPVLAVRYPNQAPLIYLSAVFFFVGYGGLIFLPGWWSWLWVLLAGLGPILFPLNLALFNIRSKSQETLLRISGFAQGFGYLAAALGPLVLGVLHELTGNWTSSLWFLFLSAVPAVIAGSVISKQRSIDEELESRA
jgi:CP family cyanate transporter-like MFS transporter